uniref:Uncharacterized protein n=1 Tax=Romanomermis culicivorax TaxID=13658 RepID=A0A915JN78_ROMCU
MGNWWIEQKGRNVSVDWAPPVRIVAIITLITTTLDLLADIIMAIKLNDIFRPFTCSAFHATIFFFIFAAVSAVIYVIEWVDCIVTLKNNQETRWLCKLSRSLAIVFEEIPLPLCMLIIYCNQPSMSLAQPGLFVSIIKLIALTWGIVKFIKIRFCWFFMPCCLDHGYDENVRRCFNFTVYRVVMLAVNICHVIAIVLTIINIVIYGRGGQQTPFNDYPPCYPSLTY